jgi:hypothetical protein
MEAHYPSRHGWRLSATEGLVLDLASTAEQDPAIMRLSVPLRYFQKSPFYLRAIAETLGRYDAKPLM